MYHVNFIFYLSYIVFVWIIEIRDRYQLINVNQVRNWIVYSINLVIDNKYLWFIKKQLFTVRWLKLQLNINDIERRLLNMSHARTSAYSASTVTSWRFKAHSWLWVSKILFWKNYPLCVEIYSSFMRMIKIYRSL